jgi:branched-chain amino acid transport system ATP-binding protein
LLRCDGVTKAFGSTVALNRVHLEVERGEIVGLIGPNGSGKSTLINMVSGFYHPDAGTVELDGTRIDSRSPHVIRRLGISRTFQNLRLYDELSVLDNLLIALTIDFMTGPADPLSIVRALLWTPGAIRKEKVARARAMEALEQIGLSGHRDRRVKDLAYGAKKRLELARVTLAAPKLMLLDEPTAGLSPSEANDILHLFQRPAREQGVAVVVVEHRLEWVLEVCDRVVVLNAGEKIADAPPLEILENAEVRRAYVGE